MDFLVDAAGQIELYEAKWIELPSKKDAANLVFVRNILGKPRVAGGGVLCRTPHDAPLAEGFRALPVTALGD